MQIRFSYQPPTAGNHEVGIAGDFTEWKIHSLQDIGDVYLISYDLKPGRYRYKYIVDGLWMPDPSHQKREADPFGGENSILELEESEIMLDWETLVRDAAKRELISYLDIHRVKKDLFDLLFKWPQHLAESVHLQLDTKIYPLIPFGLKDTNQVWQIQAQITETTDIRIIVRYQGQQIILGADGSSDHCLPFPLNPEHYPLFEIPDWVSEGIIYQIFMDRFYNGDPKLNQDFHEDYYEDAIIPPAPGGYLPPNQEYYHFVDDWNDIVGLQQSKYLPEGKPDWWCFYGGDIEGVRQKLDYLEELGVTIIYFNPLWEAKSVHKYDAADFRRVDPHFGSAKALKELVGEMHRRGMRVILDVAFNHSGKTFWAFRDCVEKGEQSSYWHWYDWFKWPLPKPLPPDFKPKDYYQCWWGIKDMPDLNYDHSRQHPFENYIRDIANAEVNGDLVDYILDCAQWWVSFIGMDGFRLDVPDEVPWWFWELFRQRIKAAKPDAWLVGEIWNNAESWVSRKYFDSVMNYAYFNSPVLEFFIHRLISRTEFQTAILSGFGAYPPHAAKAMMNLLGSHDTQRVMTLAKREATRVKQAVFFQMTSIGTPHIYYGDEIGMEGGKDPDNRRPFNWLWEKDPNAVEIRDFYKRCIALRKLVKLLRDGNMEFLAAPEGLLAYRRHDDEASVICAINTSPRKQTLKLTPAEIVFSEGKIRQGKQGYVLDANAMCVVKDWS